MADPKPLDQILYCEPGRIFCNSKDVLLVVDGSPETAKAATVAFEIAEMTNSKLFIVHVIPMAAVNQFVLMSDLDADEVIRKYEVNGRKLLEGYKAAASEFNLEVELILEKGTPSERIIAVADEHGVDIVVMTAGVATSGRRSTVANSTERVILGTECPVIVV